MRKERINLAERFNWKWIMMVIMAFVLSLPVSAKLCHACPEETYRVNVASGYLALRNAQCYDDSNIMAIISRLRKKLEVNPGNPKYIQTIKGVGYRFNKEV